MHEMLDNFDLINMNGRAYDPLLGQFLSPDPFVSNPENPQGYNRYAYCLNNPLKYTDPSGYNFSSAWIEWSMQNPGRDRGEFLQERRLEMFNEKYLDFFGKNIGPWSGIDASGQKLNFDKRFEEWTNNQPMYGGTRTNYHYDNPGPDPGNWISGPVINEKGPHWINDPSLKYTENYQINGWDFCSSNLISFITGRGLKVLHYSTTSYASQELAKSEDLRKMMSLYINGQELPISNFWFSPTINDPKTYLPSLLAHFNALMTSSVCLFVGTMELTDVKKFDDQTFLLTIKNDLGFSTLACHLAKKDKDWGNGRFFDLPISRVTQNYHILYHYKPKL